MTKFVSTADIIEIVQTSSLPVAPDSKSTLKRNILPPLFTVIVIVLTITSILTIIISEKHYVKFVFIRPKHERGYQPRDREHATIDLETMARGVMCLCNKALAREVRAVIILTSVVPSNIFDYCCYNYFDRLVPNIVPHRVQNTL